MSVCSVQLCPHEDHPLGSLLGMSSNTDKPYFSSSRSEGSFTEWLVARLHDREVKVIGFFVTLHINKTKQWRCEISYCALE